MSDVVIKVENLYKEYALGVISHGTLTHDLQSWWARMRGKEDPNSLISVHHNKDAEEKSFLALKDINFEVKQGDRIGIIGKNGAGKSTLLKILSKITTPTIGQIKIKGRIGALLEVGTGFHSELTGRENIYLNGAILGMTKKEINRKLDEIIDFAGIEKYIDTPVKRYSSGMNVRLGFAVAAHLEPEILIVDEVLAVGDVEFQKKAIGKMEGISKGDGRTILFVSHNMGAIKQLCNKVIVLNKGKILFIDDNVNKGIDLYLNSSKQRNDGRNNKIDNEYLELIDFNFVDESGHQTTGNISNDKIVYIEIVFHLKQKHPAFNIGYALYGGGDLYYISMSTDYPQKEWPELVIGKNVIRSAIPTHLLNEGDYHIKLYASFHFIKAIINPDDDDTPSLELSIQGGLSDSPYWYNRRPGICAPVIKWYKINKDL